MRFTLVYEGPLPSTQRGVSPIKTDVQSSAHQMEEQVRGRLDKFDFLQSQVHGHDFLCMVNDRVHTGAELDILS